MNLEEILIINKALSNVTRMHIINWLKTPEKHFPPHPDLGHFNDGVCGQFIKDKTNLSQPTISSYLATLQKAGLLIPTRHGKWTYFKRNEKTINEYVQALNTTL